MAKKNNKNIVCKKCESKKNEDGKIVVTCTECKNMDDKTFICDDLESVDNDNGNICICLKNKESDDIYISCTEYVKDLD